MMGLSVAAAQGSSAVDVDAAGADPALFAKGVSFAVSSLQRVSAESVLAPLR